MPVKINDASPKPGDYFFAGDGEGYTNYCRMTEPGEALVINGNYEVAVDHVSRSVSLPSGRKLYILYVGTPDIPNPDDYNEALAWFKDTRDAGGLTNG